MADTEETGENENSEREAFPSLSVITIVIDDEGRPAINLGDVSPYAAISIFSTAADTLNDMMTPPKVTYKDKVILDMGISYGFESMVFDFDDDDDEWDDEL